MIFEYKYCWLWPVWSKGRGFESRPVRFQVTALGKLLTRMCLCQTVTKQYNLVPADGR